MSKEGIVMSDRDFDIDNALVELIELAMCGNQAAAIDLSNDISDQFAHAMPKSEGKPVEVLSEWLATEISAIPTRYNGSPSYDHDAYYFKTEVLGFIDKHKSVIDATPQPTTDISEKPAAKETVSEWKPRFPAGSKVFFDRRHPEAPRDKTPTSGVVDSYYNWNTAANGEHYTIKMAKLNVGGHLHSVEEECLFTFTAPSTP